MESKEALEKLKDEVIPTYALELNDGDGYHNMVMRLYNTIKQDLDNLEKLAKESYELLKENYKLKKVIKLLKKYIELKSVLDFDTYLISLDKSDQNLLEEF